MHTPYRRLVKKKKEKKRTNTSRVCLLPVSSTDYLRTIRLHSAFFGAGFALTELQENAKGRWWRVGAGSDGPGAACVIPHPPGQGVNKHRTNTDQMDRPAESIGGFSSQRGKAIAEIISLNNTDGGEGMVWGSWAKRAGSKHTLWVLSSILEVKKYNKSFSILSTK